MLTLVYLFVLRIQIQFIEILYLNLFQKMAAPGVEGSDRSSPGTPNGEVTTSNAERQEYLEVNFKYPFVNIRLI